MREREKRESCNRKSCDLDIKYSSGSMQGPKPNCSCVIERYIF